MEFHYLIKGLLIGLSVAAPVGPIGVLTIKRSLSEGRLSGFVTGMGAALADTVYGAVAGFGLSAISGFLMAQAFWLKLVGGLFLLYLGYKALMSRPASKEAEINSKGLLGNFISTFFLTVTNPSTIFSFLAIFAGLGLGAEKNDYPHALLLVLGVFLGSSAWWLILSSAVGSLRTKIRPVHLLWINRLSGLLILGFGIWALCSAIFH